MRDPEVRFDGERIVFSMRTNAADSYHVYEIRADGSNLRQLTFAADVDDLDPLYLPDDRIAFSSTREPKYCLQLLDRDGMMIQSMRSGTMVQSGEQAGCVGCHEDRRQAPPVASLGRSGALHRVAATLDGWHGPARDFSFRAEVQPVLDRHCVRCHDFDTPAGQVLNLAGDRELVFNTAYIKLWRKQWIRVVGAGPPEIQPAYSWGSHASKLIATLRAAPRCSSSLSPEDWDRLVTWNRPELSPSLAGLTDEADPRYRAALALIRTGAERLARQPEADAPGFEPNATDQWRDAKYLARQQREQENRKALRSGAKRYD